MLPTVEIVLDQKPPTSQDVGVLGDELTTRNDSVLFDWTLAPTEEPEDDKAVNHVVLLDLLDTPSPPDATSSLLGSLEVPVFDFVLTYGHVAHKQIKQQDHRHKRVAAEFSALHFALANSAEICACHRSGTSSSCIFCLFAIKPKRQLLL